MARPWRLRHKLGLGLGLVVGSVGLLLAGALFGLSSYADTMRGTTRKLDEMQYVAQVRDLIHRMAADPDGEDAPRPPLTPLQRERDHILALARGGEKILAAYADQFGGGGPDEAALVARLRAGFAQVEDAVTRATGPGVSADPDRRLIAQEKVAAAHAALDRVATTLFQYEIAHIKQGFDRSSASHRRSLYMAGSATALAVVLVLTLLHYFRVWVFVPIKAIQAGVHRVHDGDFDHPIRLASRDELHELADEFNAMAGRMLEVQTDLARQVDERSKKLVEADKMVSVGFLAAGVAHEINNPLASIAFCAEALERRLAPALAAAPADADVIVKYLGMIGQEAFRCKQITERLLNYSRAGSGRREPTDLAVLIQNVLDLLKHHPASRDRRMVFHAEGVPVVAVDPPEIQSMINNLVVNALENMDAGGTVAVDLRPGPGGTAEIVVRDSGCGMTPEVLRHIYEAFYTRSRTGNGNGLGLWISNRVVTEHGGTITAASDGPGRGSTFTVRLPDRKPESAGVSVGVSENQDTDDPRLLAFPGARSAA